MINNGTLSLSWTDNIKYHYQTKGVLAAIKAIFAFSSGARVVNVVEVNNFMQSNPTSDFAKSLYDRYCTVHASSKDSVGSNQPMGESNVVIGQKEVSSFSAGALSELLQQDDDICDYCIAVFVDSVNDILGEIAVVSEQDLRYLEYILSKDISLPRRDSDSDSDSDDEQLSDSKNKKDILYSDQDGVVQLSYYFVNDDANSFENTVVGIRYADGKKVVVGIGANNGMPKTQDIVKNAMDVFSRLNNEEEELSGLIIPQAEDTKLEVMQEWIKEASNDCKKGTTVLVATLEKTAAPE